MKNQKGSADGIGIVIIVVFFLAVIITGLMWGLPNYSVWQRELSGIAELKNAEWTRKIAIEEARAKHESAELLASAEIERAKGVAQANKIIGDSLQGNEAYLKYLWIEGLKDSSGERVYIPTEAGLPILEAKK